MQSISFSRFSRQQRDDMFETDQYIAIKMFKIIYIYIQKKKNLL